MSEEYDAWLATQPPVARLRVPGYEHALFMRWVAQRLSATPLQPAKEAA